MPSDPIGAFTTHSNYLRALASEAGLRFPMSEVKALAELAQRVSSLPSLQDAPPATSDLEQIRRSLASAWGTELLLALSGRVIEDDEVIRLANNWAVVQVYYVAYHAAQALTVAKGFPRPDSHGKTQNQYLSLLVNRPLDLPPWSFGAKDGGWCNPPSGRTIDPSIHPWTGCSTTTQLSLIATAYRTTRREEAAEALRQARTRKQGVNRKTWRNDEAQRLQAGRRPRKEPRFPLPQLTPTEKAQIESRVPPSSLIQYLYRLRIKANYVDAMMFTDGPSDDVSSAVVHRDIRYLASGTLLVHEMHIRQLVGPARLRKWADTWLASNAPTGAPTVGLAARRQYL